MVAPGQYQEQVTINKNRLSVRSQKPLAATIIAPAALDQSRAAVHITADDVQFTGFTVTGPSPDLEIGVLVDADASAEVRSNLIQDIRPADALGGAQIGWGIWVGGLVTGGATATLVDNVITDYQKAGIVVFDPTSYVTITRNTVVGSGPTDAIAQNGIELQEGANGTISHNKVSDNIYTPAGTEATGILIEAAGQADVSHNDVFNNELGIAAVDQVNPLKISHNKVTNNVLDGIYLQNVVDAKVFQNASKDNGRSGVYVTGQSSNNQIEKNDLRDNDGPDAYDDTIGNGTGGTANFWVKNKCDDDNRGGSLC